MENAELAKTDGARPDSLIAEHLPSLPPIPVWDEQIAAFVGKLAGYVCESAADLETAKALRKDGTALRDAIQQTYDAVLDVIDRLRDPIADKKKADLTRLKIALDAMDAMAKAFLVQEQRKAEAEAERKRQEEIARREDERARAAKVASLFGDEGEAEKIAETPIVQPRAVKAETGLTYARGVRVRPKRKFRVVDPAAVKPEYKDPSIIRIQAAMEAYFMHFPQAKAGDEATKKFEAQVQGIEVYFE